MITVDVDMREFDAAMQKYMQYSKRSFAEACNQHAYYIARNAVVDTVYADKTAIENKMNSPSNVNPNAPLAAILINKQRAKQGKGGLTGDRMRREVEKFIRIRKSHVNFLRAGWIPAIKKLAAIVPRKGGGATLPGGVQKSSWNFGDATPAVESFNPECIIQNNVHGKNNEVNKLYKLLAEGISKAIAKETKSMYDYIERKQQEIINNL